jgi:hypothetical protein
VEEDADEGASVAACPRARQGRRGAVADEAQLAKVCEKIGELTLRLEFNIVLLANETLF